MSILEWIHDFRVEVWGGVAIYALASMFFTLAIGAWCIGSLIVSIIRTHR